MMTPAIRSSDNTACRRRCYKLFNPEPLSVAKYASGGTASRPVESTNAVADGSGLNDPIPSAWRKLLYRASFPGWLLIFVCTALAAHAEDKPTNKADEAKKSSAKSAAKPDDFKIATLDKAERELLAKLRQPVTFDWDNLPLPDAVAKLHAATKVKFSVDEADLKKRRLDGKAKVSGKWKDRPLEEVLEEFLSPARLDYIIEGYKVVIVSQSRATIALVTLTYQVERLCPDDESLQRLLMQVVDSTDPFEWEFMSGPASITKDPDQHTLTIKQSWSRHAAFRNVMRDFKSRE